LNKFSKGEFSDNAAPPTLSAMFQQVNADVAFGLGPGAARSFDEPNYEYG